MTELFQFVNGTFVPTNLSGGVESRHATALMHGTHGAEPSVVTEQSESVSGSSAPPAQNLFDGSTYSPRLDEARLNGQLQRVRDLMSDSVWRTLSDISKALGDPEASKCVDELLSLPVRHLALENPVSVISTIFRKPDQTIQPWQFGHGEVKATCLWLKNLPKLVPTNIVDGREPRVHYASPGPDRWKERSRTLPGIAEAMADQWGAFCVSEMEGNEVR